MATRFSATHQVRLAVEMLEARLTPDAASYVGGLYTSVLHRVPSPAETAAWVAQFNSGQSATNVAAALWLSPEHRGLQVDGYFQNFLKRAESALERQVWINRFTNGGLSETQVQLAFLISPEFLSLHQDSTSYTAALYQDVLGRAPDDSGQVGWISQLQSGQSHANVALRFLSSPEGLTVAVTRDYNQLLNRTPDQPGLNGWVGALLDTDPGDTDDFNNLNHNTTRDPDNSQFPKNLGHFLDNLIDKPVSLEELAVDFLTSSEFVADHPTAP